MSEETQWGELLGKRVLWQRLFKEIGMRGAVVEGIVEDLSSTGGYVKVCGRWHIVSEIKYLETLSRLNDSKESV